MELLLLGDLGFDTNRQSVRPLRATWPICHADWGPVRLCEQAFGTTGTGRQTGQRGGREGGVGLRGAGEASAWQDG